MLNEVAKIATQDLELRPMLQRIATTLRRRLGGDLVTLLSVDRDRFVCEALATDLATDLYVGYVGDIGTGVVVPPPVLTVQDLAVLLATSSTAFTPGSPAARSPAPFASAGAFASTGESSHNGSRRTRRAQEVSHDQAAHIPRLLGWLGYSIQRPRKRLARADAEAQRVWLHEQFPKI